MYSNQDTADSGQDTGQTKEGSEASENKEPEDNSNGKAEEGEVVDETKN